MGAWEVLEESSQVAAVHAALLPSGEVVYYSGNTGQAHPRQLVAGIRQRAKCASHRPFRRQTYSAAASRHCGTAKSS
jgi:hypothetical protein